MRSIHLPRPALPSAGWRSPACSSLGSVVGQAADPSSPAADPPVPAGPGRRWPAPERAARRRGRPRDAGVTRASNGAGPFDHRTFDEVTPSTPAAARSRSPGSSSMGRSRWRSRSAGAVRRGALDGPAAERRASRLAQAAGVPSRPAHGRASAGAGGWTVAWTRTVDGVAVRGDGVRIAVWPDGSFHGLTGRSARWLRRRTRLLGAAEARRARSRGSSRPASPARPATVHVAAERAWVAPNDAFGGPRPMPRPRSSGSPGRCSSPRRARSPIASGRSRCGSMPVTPRPRRRRGRMNGHPPAACHGCPEPTAGAARRARRAARPATIAVVAAVLGASSRPVAGPAVGPSRSVRLRSRPASPGSSSRRRPLRITDEGGGASPRAVRGERRRHRRGGVVVARRCRAAPRRRVPAARLACGPTLTSRRARDEPRLAAVSPTAADRGRRRRPQGPSFDLRIVDPGTGTTRSLSVPIVGLNGAPAWLGPGDDGRRRDRADG